MENLTPKSSTIANMVVITGTLLCTGQAEPQEPDLGRLAMQEDERVSTLDLISMGSMKGILRTWAHAPARSRQACRAGG